MRRDHAALSFSLPSFILLSFFFSPFLSLSFFFFLSYFFPFFYFFLILIASFFQKKSTFFQILKRCRFISTSCFFISKQIIGHWTTYDLIMFWPLVFSWGLWNYLLHKKYGHIAIVSLVRSMNKAFLLWAMILHWYHLGICYMYILVYHPRSTHS